MDGGAWWATVHGVAKSRTRLSDFNFTFHFSLLLEKEMATHSSVLAWRIPGTGWMPILGDPGAHAVGVPSRHGDPREDHGEALPQPRHDPTPDPRRPASPRPGRAPGALPTFTTGSR